MWRYFRIFNELEINNTEIQTLIKESYLYFRRNHQADIFNFTSKSFQNTCISSAMIHFNFAEIYKVQNFQNIYSATVD